MPRTYAMQLCHAADGSCRRPNEALQSEELRSMAPHTQYGLEELNVPSFIAQKRVNKTTGEIRCRIALGKCCYNKETKKRYISGQKVVGIVEKSQAFGRILFKEEFLEQYPQLRAVTVWRLDNGKYVYTKERIEPEAYQSAYKQPGRPRYKPNPTQAPQ